MQARLFNIFEDPIVDGQPERVLSLNRFLSHLEGLSKQQADQKEVFFMSVLNRFQKAQQKYGALSEHNISSFVDELYYLYNLFIPLLTDESEVLWGLALPLSGKVFYGTDAFYRFLQQEHGPGSVMDKIEIPNGEAKLLVYKLIFERLYGFSNVNVNRPVYAVEQNDPSSLRYYAISVDNTFVDVQAKGPLPPIKYELLKGKKIGEIKGTDLKNLVELKSFRIEGFSIIYLEDITHEYVIENLKKIVIIGGKYDSQWYQESVEGNLRILTGNSKLKVRITPILKLNGQPLMHHQLFEGSLLYSLAQQIGEEKVVEYLQNPYSMASHVDADFLKVPSFLDNVALNLGLESLAIAPLLHNNRAVGLLELYTEQGCKITANVLSALRPVLPLLTQFANDICVDFKTKMNNIILERFTALQPAVQWKFNEAAWSYLRRANEDGSSVHPAESGGEVRFDKVNPLYGAVDIRNSTLKRNDALLADLSWQLDHLHTALAALKEHHDLPDRLVKQTEELKQMLDISQLDYMQIAISEFINREIKEAFSILKNAGPPLADVILDYERKMDPAGKQAHRHKQAFETAVKIINQTTNHYLEEFNDKLQAIYPCYFEKFRTDGVEFDCYVGQSITPHIRFSTELLRQIKCLQLDTMVAIAGEMHRLVDKLPVALETTQLIFVNNGEIDIGFREDERRFDVEGAYNIRYHVIKKRIDKALVKGSSERVTQPGKVTIIYFNEETLYDYLQHVEHLQHTGALRKKVEYLELGELQGVSGLRALRVEVVV